jgi:hypothetical protein
VRRLFWVAFGVGLGAATAIMGTRWTKRQAERQRAKPAAIAREAKGGLLDLSKLVAESIEEGKRASEQRERELRARYAEDGPTN